jgi:SAM-dependent methyltransferase
MTNNIINILKEIADLFFVPYFNLKGRRPWSLGYYSVKKQAICNAIDAQLLEVGSPLPQKFGIGIDERVVEYPWIYSQLPNRPVKMLDAGSSLNHAFLIDRLPLDHMQLTIMTLAPEKRSFWSRSVSYVYGDLRRPEFAEKSFDVVVSISTIEHIGLNNTLLYTGDASKNEADPLGFVPAVKEFRRILKPGGLCLITVPYGRREICDWYQVFDASLLQEVVKAFGPTEAHIEYFGYSIVGWQRATADHLEGAVFQDASKSTCSAPDKAAAARGVACLRLMA